MAIKNIKQWKTTSLGLFLIASSLAYLFLSEVIIVTIFAGLLTGGIALLFVPDTIIINLKRFINKFVKAYKSTENV